MKLNRREIVLGAATAAVLRVWATWMAFEPRWEELREAKRRAREYEMIVERSEQLLAGRDRWNERLAAQRDKLPAFPEGAEVTAELLRQLERLARAHGLTLLKAVPEEEEQGAELYSISIHYTWEGELEALVRFLYALQTEVGNMDVQRLNISPMSREEQLLKGGFTVEAAFTRDSEERA
jgi:hypothetical protein